MISVSILIKIYRSESRIDGLFSIIKGIIFLKVNFFFQGRF